MNEILLEFAGRMADQGATQLPGNFRQVSVNAQFFLKTRMAGCETGKRIEDISDFNLNLKKGRIILKFQDQEDVSADAQIAGTVSDDGTWMWGWGHPEVPEQMQQAAWAVQQFGERQEIEDLLSRGGPVDEAMLKDYLAICAYISDADGVFLGEHGAGGRVCICYYLNDQMKGLVGK